MVLCIQMCIRERSRRLQKRFRLAEDFVRGAEGVVKEVGTCQQKSLSVSHLHLIFHQIFKETELVNSL